LYGALADTPATLPVLDMVIKGHNIWLSSGNDTRRKARPSSTSPKDSRRALSGRSSIETFTFGEMVEAHRYLEQNGQFGKIVVTV
jgi:Zinc-binding dehydrogenase